MRGKRERERFQWCSNSIQISSLNIYGILLVRILYVGSQGEREEMNNKHREYKNGSWSIVARSASTTNQV
jgi:hypothetical protein